MAQHQLLMQIPELRSDIAVPHFCALPVPCIHLHEIWHVCFDSPLDLETLGLYVCLRMLCSIRIQYTRVCARLDKCKSECACARALLYTHTSLFCGVEGRGDDHQRNLSDELS